MLYYLGIMQWIVKGMAAFMMKFILAGIEDPDKTIDQLVAECM